MNPFTIAKLVVIGIAIAGIIAVAVAYRHELVEKGKNLVYAEDNAARVKAQEDQIKNDALKIEDLQEANRRRQTEGGQIKETIRVVQGPCVKDGADDARLKQFSDWLQSRPSPNSGPADNRRPPEAAVPKARP